MKNLIALASLCLLIFTNVALACPLCGGQEQLPLSVLFDQFNTSAIFKVARLEKPPFDPDYPGMKRVVLTPEKNLKGIPPKEYTYLSSSNIELGTRYALFGKKIKQNPFKMEHQIELIHFQEEFLNELANGKVEKRAELIWNFLWKYPKVVDTLFLLEISESWHGEDSKSFFQAYISKKNPPLQAFRIHLQNEALNFFSKQIYIHLLGVSKQAEDLPMFEKFLGAESDEFRPLENDYMKAYLNCSLADGLLFIDSIMDKGINKSFSYRYAYMDVLRSIYQDQTHALYLNLKVLQRLRDFLSDKDISDLVISSLSRIKDWYSAPQVFEQFKITDYSGTRRAGARFMMSMRDQSTEEIDKLLATDWLNVMREIDPKAVKDAERTF